MNDRRPPSILIVDDEPAVLLSHAAILERLGYKITTADSGDQALKSLEDQRFDLLICDLSLGEVNGLDIIAAALRQDRHVRVILMTGYADTMLPKELADANVIVVTKPANIPEFLDTIKRLLRRDNGSDQTQAAD